ncbi:MAG: nucleoside triphosphate pyrophosphohydrolase [Vicingaceae bacterium]|nr:MAG: nucleoside triphosphate pyrophosphohydrolase [Vicingaceae bacterium]
MKRQKEINAFIRLLDIMDDLREKCPWDKKQTLESLRPLTIEEVYELSETILKKDLNGLEKELGDVLLHIVFYAKIGKELNAFDISSVINRLCEKLIERHPHIYGSVKVENEEEVKSNWEKLKLKEGNQSVLSGVPDSLPSILQAFRIQEKVRGVGFDWENVDDVWNKVKEEWDEFSHAVKVSQKDKMEEEFGDLLFALVNLSRFYGINPDEALYKANMKFKKRFQKMEEMIKSQGKEITSMKLAEMDQYWDKVKEDEKKI